MVKRQADQAGYDSVVLLVAAMPMSRWGLGRVPGPAVGERQLLLGD
jgi:hypothetical protein